MTTYGFYDPEQRKLKSRWASLRDAMEDLRDCVAVMRPGQNLPLSRESANDLANLIDGALKMVADVVGHDTDVVKLRTVDVAGLTGHHGQKDRDRGGNVSNFKISDRVWHPNAGSGTVMGYRDDGTMNGNAFSHGLRYLIIKFDSGLEQDFTAGEIYRDSTEYRAQRTLSDSECIEAAASLGITSDLTGGSRVFVPEHGRFYPEHPVEVRPEGTFYDGVQISSTTYKLSDFPGLVGNGAFYDPAVSGPLPGKPKWNLYPSIPNFEPSGLGLHPDRHDTEVSQYHHDFEITDLISHPTFGVGEVMKIDEYGWIDVKRNGNIYTLRPSGFQILAKMAKETVGVDPKSEDWIRPGVFCTHKGERGLIIWKGGSTFVEVQMEVDDTTRIVQSSDVAPLKAPKPDRTPPTSDSGVHDNPIVRAVIADLEGGDKSLIGAAFQRWADRDF